MKPSPYGIETLSIYRDRDLRHRRRPRPKRDQNKNQKKDLETVIGELEGTPAGNGIENRTVSAVGLGEMVLDAATVAPVERGRIEKYRPTCAVNGAQKRPIANNGELHNHLK